MYATKMRVDDDLEQKLCKKYKIFSRTIMQKYGLQAREYKMLHMINNLTKALHLLKTTKEEDNDSLQIVRFFSNEVLLCQSFSPKVYQAWLKLLKVLIQFSSDPRILSEVRNITGIVGRLLFDKVHLPYLDEFFQKLHLEEESYQQTNGWHFYSCLRNSIEETNDGSILAALYQEFLENQKKSGKWEQKGRLFGLFCSLLGVPIQLSSNQVLPKPTQMAGETRYLALESLLSAFCSNDELRSKELNSVFTLLEQETQCPDRVCRCLNVLLQSHPTALSSRVSALLAKCLAATAGFQNSVEGAELLLLSLVRIFQKKSEMTLFHRTLMKNLEVLANSKSLHVQRLPVVLSSEILRHPHLLPDKHRQEIWAFLNTEVSRVSQGKLSDWKLNYLHLAVDLLCLHMKPPTAQGLFRAEVLQTKDLISNLFQIDPYPLQLVPPYLLLWKGVVSQAKCQDLDLGLLLKMLKAQQKLEPQFQHLGLQILFAYTQTLSKTNRKLVSVLAASHPEGTCSLLPTPTLELTNWTLWLDNLVPASLNKPQYLRDAIRQVVGCALESEEESWCLEFLCNRFPPHHEVISTLLTQLFSVAKECLQAPKRKSMDGEITDFPITALETLISEAPMESSFYSAFNQWVRKEASSSTWKLNVPRLTKLIQILNSKMHIFTLSLIFATKIWMCLLVLLPSAKKSLQLEVARLLLHVGHKVIASSACPLPYSLLAELIFDHLVVKGSKENPQLFDIGIKILDQLFLEITKEPSKLEKFVSLMAAKLQGLQSSRVAEQINFMLCTAAMMVPAVHRETVGGKLAELFAATGSSPQKSDPISLWCCQACSLLSSEEELNPSVLKQMKGPVRNLKGEMTTQLSSTLLQYLLTTLKKRHPAVLTIPLRREETPADATITLEDGAAASSPPAELPQEEEDLLTALVAVLSPELQESLLGQLHQALAEDNLEVVLVLWRSLVKCLPPSVFGPHLYPMLESCHTYLSGQTSLSPDQVAHFYRPLVLLVAEALKKDRNFPAVGLVLQLCLPCADLSTAALRPMLAVSSTIHNLLPVWIHHPQALTRPDWIVHSTQVLFEALLQAGEQSQFLTLPQPLQEEVTQAANEMVKLCGLIGSKKHFTHYVGTIVCLYPLAALRITPHPTIKAKIWEAIAPLLALDKSVIPHVASHLPPGAREVFSLMCEDFKKSK